MSTELLKRKKELEAEFEELNEMEDDAINTRTKMTIASVGVLLKSLNTHLIDMAEIAHKKKYYDEGLTEALQNTVEKLTNAFSQIKPSEIKVAAPTINVDFKPLESAVNKMNDTSQTLINLVNKFNNNGQNDKLYNLIVSLVEKQNSFLNREIKHADYTNQFTSIEKAINNRPTEFKSKVTSYNDQNRIEEITTTVRNGR